jgi:hypothetical protein
MKIKTFTDTAKTFKALQDFAIIVQTGTRFETLQALHALKALPLFANKKGWQANFAKLESVIVSGLPMYSVLALNGNSKLPFVSFSSLPGVTCPGAGACLDFCYSFRAWRYPAAFMRQCQNAFLLRHNQPAIVQALQVANDTFKGESYDVRLYVDGDFANNDDVTFWFDTIKTFPLAKVYGYSKSFEAILSYGAEYPTNYMLNISGGHNASIETINKVKALPITRGEFIAVSIGKKVKGHEHGTKEINKALRESFKIKAFPCPGTCGTCTGKGHACGMQALKGVPIIIAMH